MFDLAIHSFTFTLGLEDGIDFGTAWSEIGSDEGQDDEEEFGEGEVVVVVVEEDVD